MPLRVTQSMMQTQLLRNLNSNSSRLDHNQNVLSSGKKILRPSDDPVGITYALRYRSELSMNEQYQSNVDAAKSLVDHTDTVMGQVNEVFQRALELTQQGVNGTNPQSAMDAIASELDQLYQHAVSLGNDQLNGKYIFNGQKTDVQPYAADYADSKNTDGQTITSQFAAGITIPISSTGDQVFGTGANSFFSLLRDAHDALTGTTRNPATGAITSSTGAANQNLASQKMGQMQALYGKFLDKRSEVGAVANRLDLIGNRVKDLKLNLNTLDANTEDADMAATIIQLKTDQNVYQASLSAGAKIIQPSLIDYLR